MKFLDNLKVAAKVVVSFGTILELLAMSSAIAVWGLTSAMRLITCCSRHRTAD